MRDWNTWLQGLATERDRTTGTQPGVRRWGWLPAIACTPGGAEGKVLPRPVCGVGVGAGCLLQARVFCPAALPRGLDPVRQGRTGMGRGAPCFPEPWAALVRHVLPAQQ